MKKENFWLKLYPNKAIEQLREMSYTYKQIENRSKRSFLMYILLLVLVPILLMRIDQPLFALLPLSIIGVLYFNDKHLVNIKYEDFVQKRQIEFLYFFQLLVPHLKQAGSSRIGLYAVLTKMEERLQKEDEDGNGGILKSGVNRLLIDITNRPADIEAFKEFARTCSGSSVAEDVSIALYDWQQNNNDAKQLDRLKLTINHALDKRVEEIKEKKLARFDYYSSRVLLSVVILSVGILLTTIFIQGMSMFNNLPS